MSQEHVDSFNRGIEAWNGGNLDGWLEQMDPEVEWVALMEVYRGHEGVRQAWASFKENVDLEVRFDDVRASAIPCSPSATCGPPAMPRR
jgi:hypothetical protein